MEFITTKENLHRAVQFLQGISDKKNIMPILSHISLICENGNLRLSATDLEVSIQYDISIQEKAEGPATVPSRKFFEIVKELPETDIGIISDQNNNITIRCKDIVFRLKGLAHEEFPRFPSFKESEFCQVDSRILNEMIEKTIYSVATEEMQYNLNGVCLEKISESGYTRFVATDGHRLSLIDRNIDLGLLNEKSIIVPRKGLIEIKRVMQDTQKDCIWGIIENHLVVKFENSSLFVRLIDGMFPNYKDVIPKFTPKRVRVNREELLEALRRAAIVSQDKFRGVNVQFAKNMVVVSSNNPDLGESEEKITADFTGEGFIMSFNSRYVTDVLGALSAETVLMELNDESSPVVIRDPMDEDFLAVVMPMRL